jgi:hypothetical protein
MPREVSDECDRRMAEVFSRCSPEFRRRLESLRAAHEASREAHAKRLREILRPFASARSAQAK